MTKEMKINFIVVPITLLIVLTATLIILNVTPKEYNLWKYYLIGSMLGLMTHGMMVKQNARIARLSKADPIGFSPKKSAMMWFLLRMFLVASILIICALLAKFQENSPIDIITLKLIVSLAGYATLKIVFLVTVVVFLLRDNSKKGTSELNDNSKMDAIEMASKHKMPQEEQKEGDKE